MGLLGGGVSPEIEGASGVESAHIAVSYTHLTLPTSYSV